MGQDAAEKIGSRENICVENNHNLPLCCPDALVARCRSPSTLQLSQQLDAVLFILLHDARGVIRRGVNDNDLLVRIVKLHQRIKRPTDVLGLVVSGNDDAHCWLIVQHGFSAHITIVFLNVLGRRRSRVYQSAPCFPYRSRSTMLAKISARSYGAPRSAVTRKPTRFILTFNDAKV